MNTQQQRSPLIDFNKYEGQKAVNLMSREELVAEIDRLEGLYPNWTLEDHANYANMLRRLPSSRRVVK